MNAGAEQLLAKAQAALDVGDAETADEHATSVLDLAVATGDKRMEAQALACLAHSSRLRARARSAHDFALRAAQLFQLSGDAVGEASVLATQAHAASMLGRNEEAVEAGLLGVELGRTLASDKLLAISYVHLGVALMFTGAFEQARIALETSVRIGERCTPPLSPFQPLVTLMCSECIRGVVVRHETRKLPDLQLLRALMVKCAGLVDEERGIAMADGVNVTLQAMWRLSAAQGHCWMNEPQLAEEHLARAQAWASGYGVKTWLNAFEGFVRCEFAASLGEYGLGRVNTNCVRADIPTTLLGWRSPQNSSPVSSTACPSSAATSA